MPKTPEQLRSLARSMTEMAVMTLAGVASSKGAPPAARVAAANSILDRGWGRPEQISTADVSGDIRVTIRQIIETIDGKGVVTIEHSPDDATT